MSCAHAGVGRCDDRHQVVTIGSVYLIESIRDCVIYGWEGSYTLGFHTLTLKGPSSIPFRRTGCGQAHEPIILKNLLMMTELTAIG